MTHPARKLLAKKRPKPIRCKAPGCQATFTRERDGQDVCGYQCGLNLHRYREARALERKRLRAARELKARKLATKTNKEHADDAQAAFNAYVRVRDHHLPCISCGRPNDGRHARHASHFRSVKACKALRYHLHNVNASCFQCNTAESGALLEYRIGLVRKLGAARVEWLECQNAPTRYSIEYLNRIKQVFTRRTKHLKKLRGYQ